MILSTGLPSYEISYMTLINGNSSSTLREQINLYASRAVIVPCNFCPFNTSTSIRAHNSSHLDLLSS